MLEPLRQGNFFLSRELGSSPSSDPLICVCVFSKTTGAAASVASLHLKKYTGEVQLVPWNI